jgi:endoglucanase
MKKILFAFLLTISATVYAQTIVQRHGQLSVQGASVKDQCGRVAQLKGMSFFWHQWQGREYWNEDVVKWLRNDWKVEIIRAAMGVRGAKDCCDYIGDSTGSVNQVRTLVNAAIKHGIYVIIDFHAHPNYKEKAKAFFSIISKEFGNYPNVIYEIWGEPIGDVKEPVTKWKEIKAYAQEVIAAIRANDPDNIIAVGTPYYDQFTNVAADDPLTVDANNNAVQNIVYTLHVYTDWHLFEGMVGDNARYAVSKGLPLWVTECGATGVKYAKPRATGINKPNYERWKVWQNWWDANGISYCKWSMSTKDEFGSVLLPSAPVKGNWDIDNHLTDEGRWNREHFRAENTLPELCTQIISDSINKK